MKVLMGPAPVVLFIRKVFGLHVGSSIPPQKSFITQTHLNRQKRTDNGHIFKENADGAVKMHLQESQTNTRELSRTIRRLQREIFFKTIQTCYLGIRI